VVAESNDSAVVEAPKKVRKVIADSDSEEEDTTTTSTKNETSSSNEAEVVAATMDEPVVSKSPTKSPIKPATTSVKSGPAEVGSVVAVGSKHEPVHYSLLCDAFVKIEDITGRLEITAIMTKLFIEVMEKHPNDLESTLFLASNKLAPPHENVILGIGESLISKCICQVFDPFVKHM
jgi:hypothetical protein